MSLHEKLVRIQNELKAPKSRYNSFGKYSYRSCEDILEAAKPLCAKHGAVLTVSDAVVHAGDRYYIEAAASLTDTETLETITVTALAREDETKKGMDGSQITGTASSYARKYALNGLFCIDDTKDADTDENRTERENRSATEPKEKTEFKQLLAEFCQKSGKQQKTVALELCDGLGVKKLEKSEDFASAIAVLKAWMK